MNPDTVDREPATALTEAFVVGPADLIRLHADLARRAAEAELLDVSYRTLDSPVGRLLVAATGTGVVRVAFALEGHDTVLQDLADRIGPRILESPAALDGAARALEEYFAGRRRVVDVAVDWRLSKGFRFEVLKHLATDVGYGTTVSYGQLAVLAGNPKAVRAVGTACATNPVPLVVPCHRIVRSDGSAGAYRGGPAAKRVLLDLEARQDFSRTR